MPMVPPPPGGVIHAHTASSASQAVIGKACRAALPAVDHCQSLLVTLKHDRNEAVPFLLHLILPQRRANHLLLQACHSCPLRPPPLRLDIQRRLGCCTSFRFRVNPALLLLRLPTLLQLRASTAPRAIVKGFLPRRVFPLSDDLRPPHCIARR